MITLKIKTDNEELKKLYSNHGYFHAGDVGIDLFCSEELETYDVANTTTASNLMSHNSPPRFRKREAFIIDFNIACEVVEQQIYYDNKIGGKQTGMLIRNLPYMLVPRSSIVKTPLIMANGIGIIDSSYRGKLKAAVYNMAIEEKSFIVQKHSRLFQIVLFSGQTIDRIEVVDTLSETVRGDNGFGSTGV